MTHLTAVSYGGAVAWATETDGGQMVQSSCSNWTSCSPSLAIKTALGTECVFGGTRALQHPYGDAVCLFILSIPKPSPLSWASGARLSEFVHET